MMLGTMKLAGTMYRGSEPTLAGELTPELLRTAVAFLPKGAYIPRDEARGPPPALLAGDAFTGIKDGAYAERSGAIVIRNGASFEPINISGSSAARVKGLMAVRDAVRLVFRTQLEDAPEERIVEARQLLNSIYDSFVARYGALSCRDNLRAFASDWTPGTVRNRAPKLRPFRARSFTCVSLTRPDRAEDTVSRLTASAMTVMTSLAEPTSSTMAGSPSWALASTGMSILEYFLKPGASTVTV